MISLFLILWGCVEKSTDTGAEDGGLDTAVDVESPQPEAPEPEEPGIPDNPNIDEMIDSTDSTAWVHYDLESSSLIPTDEVSEDNWDIAFQRYIIKLNGGVSGTGGVEVMLLAGEYENFEEVTLPEEGEWITDLEDSDGDDQPEYALDSWFDYDLATHVLSPADLVYLIRTVEGDIFRFRILDYYSSQGGSGYMSIEFDLL